MRWIVITLLIVNVAYFGWGFTQQQAARQQQVALELPPLKGAQLELLTERLPGSESAQPPPPIPVKDKPKLAQPKPAVPEPEPEPKQPLPQVVDTVEVKKEVMCTTIGPIEKENVALRLSQNLNKEGVKSAVQSLLLSREQQYWVLLPPAASRKEALQSLKALQTKKFDSYLISSGEMRNAISLGLFNKEQSAKGVLAKMVEAGFPAEIRQKERVKNEYWVRILPGQALENLQETLETLVIQGGSTKISSASCEMFAQTK
ncbi:MAG: hypothetical protein MI808_02560 [Pseudomonadales bacterium]|nr:hypothetical protein [Pseudomonadales bacterium]